MIGIFRSRLTAMWGLYHSLLSDKATSENAFRLSGLSTYQSRGKGKGKAFVRSHFSNKSKQASRSKYMPHQGEREIARRLRQDKARTLKLIKNAAAILDANPVPVPHMIRGAVNYG